MTVNQLLHACRQRLTEALGGDSREARAMVDAAIEHFRGWRPVDVAFHGQEQASDLLVKNMEDTVRRVASDGWPLQYVLGRARFMGNDYDVNPAVLIPRPETAGLVDLVTDAMGSLRDLRVVDLGTGSGCVALALARALPFSTVTGVDVSPQALEVARANAKRLRAAGSTIWQVADMLDVPSLPVGPWDVVVSNPPYVALKERAQMDPRVLDHEPAKALFVPDQDPTLFYRAIFAYAADTLAPGGICAVELNPVYAKDVESIAGAALPAATVSLHRDFVGRWRYLTAVVPPSQL